jgi:UDP-N-acetylmuramyl pentapeptide phosphotransferase/UDP-N-acetylglucosamine-1-phosphate transferase
VIRWLVALAFSGLGGLWVVPQARARAFERGWFERASQTRRSRAHRRPTHGGLVLAMVVGVAALAAGPSQPSVQATVAAAAVAIGCGWRAERGRGPSWVVPLGEAAVAAVVPIAGVRAEVTGGAVADGVTTALLVLLLIRSLRAVQRTDAAVLVLVVPAVAVFLLIAVRTADPLAGVAAALLGGTVALTASTWPPATVRLGAIGPTVIGAVLATVAIDLSPDVSAPQSLLVPVLALLPLAFAAVVPGWDRRLERRRVPPVPALAVAAGAAALAAERLAAEALEPITAFELAFLPAALLAVVGVATPRPDGDGSKARLTATFAVVVVLGCLAAISGFLVLDARSSMVTGREAATAGLETARSGDLQRAQSHFERADAAFADASRSLDSPLVRVGGFIPGIGPNVRSVRTLAEVGRDLSSTAVAVAERAGADDLAVVDGRFPVEAAAQVSAELGPAVATLREATARLAATSSALLLSEVREGSDAVAAEVAEATESIEVAAEATRLAPALLGAEEDQRWMVAVLNPSEQRGAGGFGGDYAELRAFDGVIEVVEQLPARALNQASDQATQLAALPEVYRTRYGGFRPGRFWQNLSVTPDVPTFAEGIAAVYPLTTVGGPVDGVIVLDPFALAALLEVVGPIEVPLWPEPVTGDNAAAILLFEHYDRLTEDEIDEFQGDVIEATVDALTNRTLPPVSEIAATLGPQVAAGRLRLWSPEADAQALFERIGADGSLGTRPPGADFVQLITQNAGENKIDWFMRRSISYEAVVDPATGALAATATVTIENTAPTSGVSSYIIGESPGPTLPGENELEVTVISAHRPTGVTDAAGTPLPVNIGGEQGLFAITVVLEIPAGGEATVIASFEGVQPMGNGAYELVMGRQPSIVNDRLDATVEAVGPWAPVDPSSTRTTSEGDTALVVFSRFIR